MNYKQKHDKIIARIIANTRRFKRPNNLLEIANDIECLKDDLGSIKKVADIVGISTEMLKKFLSTLTLSDYVKKLIRENKIVSITIAHLMSNFKSSSQKVIAKEVIAGNLNATDMKVLAPYARKMKGIDIKQIISHIIKSKDVKIYVILFKLKKDISNYNVIKNKFEKIIGENHIVVFKIKDSICTLELTKKGNKKLIEAAKNQKMSLKIYVESIINK